LNYYLLSLYSIDRKNKKEQLDLILTSQVDNSKFIFNKYNKYKILGLFTNKILTN